MNATGPGVTVQMENGNQGGEVDPLIIPLAHNPRRIDKERRLEVANGRWNEENTGSVQLPKIKNEMRNEK
jgi:hypothetical protein